MDEQLIAAILAAIGQGREGAELRVAWERTYGVPMQPGDAQGQLWRSSLGTAYARRRVQQALEAGTGSQTVGEVLRGTLTFGGRARLRVLVYGTDTAGFRAARVIDVVVDRDQTMNEVYAQIWDAIAAGVAGTGPGSDQGSLSDVGWAFAYGSSAVAEAQ